MGGRGSASGIGASTSSGANGITQFPDKARDGYSYGPDGPQEKFFAKNSNSSELIDQMDYDEKDAFRAWCRGTFMYGQQYDGFSNMDKYDQKLTKTYDKYLDQSTLGEGVMVVRRSSPSLVLGKGERASAESFAAAAKEGRIITSKGNMSCGAASQGLTIGDSGKKVEYRISIPKGSKGAGMWVGDKRINGWGSEQREFMMNRDTSYRVKGYHYDKTRGIHVVDLDYVGLGEHDYGTSGR